MAEALANAARLRGHSNPWLRAAGRGRTRGLTTTGRGVVPNSGTLDPFYRASGSVRRYCPRQTPNKCVSWSVGMPDQSLICRDCGATFPFDESQQRVFRERHYPDQPSRCARCRTSRRAQRSERVTTDAVCSTCGKPTQVPFIPKPGFAVLCPQCLPAARPKVRVRPSRPPVRAGRRP